MSDEANEILTLLRTTRQYVQTMLIDLPFSNILTVGLDAESRRRIILESVGHGEMVGDDGTDELLARAPITDEAAPPRAPRKQPTRKRAPEPVEEDGVGLTNQGDSEDFPPGFGDDSAEDRMNTTPAGVVFHGEPAFGEPEETEDLLRETERTVAQAMGTLGDLDDEDLHTDPGAERPDSTLAVDGPGQDALVTIDDTSDPRSDLDGLIEDSELDPGDDEVVVRKDAEDDILDLDIELEAFDLPDEDDEMSPDEEETFVADLADIQKMKAKMDAGRGAPRAAKPPRVQPSQPRAVAGVAAGGKVTAGLYGNPSVPTIRDRNAPKPAAAAIQIGDAQSAALQSGAGGSVLEEEEVLALGSSADYGEEEYDDDDSSGGGLSLDVQEYGEEEEYEDEIEELDDIELEELDIDDIELEPLDEGPSPEELAALVKKAKAAVDGGDMEAGINLYSDVLDSDPENVQAFVSRGRLYLDYGDYSRAMSDFMHAETLQPENPEPQVAVGDLHFARKDYNRAIDYFNEALKMEPNHAMAHCRRGISHYYRKNYAKALEDLNKAQKLDNDIPNIRTYITMARKKAKR